MYLKANKKLGQHFLNSDLICDQIVYSSGGFNESLVIEIGSGTGMLTRSILSLTKPKFFIAIEKDRALFALLKKQFSERNITILNADAVDIDEMSLVQSLLNSSKIIGKKDRIRLVGNLPYNISVVLLVKWLCKISDFSSITVMVQKEVADRMVSAHSSPNYGALSVFVQMQSNVDILFDVDRSYFDPEPKVLSSVLHITPKEEIDIDSDKVLSFLKVCFSHRRKMISHALKNSEYEHILDKMGEIGLCSRMRPQDIDVCGYLKLTSFL